MSDDGNIIIWLSHAWAALPWFLMLGVFVWLNYWMDNSDN